MLRELDTISIPKSVFIMPIIKVPEEQSKYVATKHSWKTSIRENIYRKAGNQWQREIKQHECTGHDYIYSY